MICVATRLTWVFVALLFMGAMATTATAVTDGTGLPINAELPTALDAVSDATVNNGAILSPTRM